MDYLLKKKIAFQREYGKQHYRKLYDHFLIDIPLTYNDYAKIVGIHPRQFKRWLRTGIFGKKGVALLDG